MRASCTRRALECVGYHFGMAFLHRLGGEGSIVRPLHLSFFLAPDRQDAFLHAAPAIQLMPRVRACIAKTSGRVFHAAALAYWQGSVWRQPGRVDHCVTARRSVRFRWAFFPDCEAPRGAKVCSEAGAISRFARRAHQIRRSLASAEQKGDRAALICAPFGSRQERTPHHQNARRPFHAVTSALLLVLSRNVTSLRNYVHRSAYIK